MVQWLNDDNVAAAIVTQNFANDVKSGFDEVSQLNEVDGFSPLYRQTLTKQARKICRPVRRM